MQIRTNGIFSQFNQNNIKIINCPLNNEYLKILENDLIIAMELTKRSVIDLIREDFLHQTRLKYSRFNVFKLFVYNRGFRAIFIHRKIYYSKLVNNKINYIFWKIINHCSNLSIFIGEGAKIGEGFRIIHPYDITIGDATIGKNCKIYQGVTIGANYSEMDVDNCYPKIGDNVIISPGAVILGSITIGSDVIIGANSVVIRDVPNNSVVAGVPAKIIGPFDDARFNRAIQ